MILAKDTIRHTALATAVTASLGIATLPSMSIAAIHVYNLSGWFTLIDPGGVGFNNSDAAGPPMYGWRTPVSGSMTFDTTANTGTMTLAPFSFSAGGLAVATSITFQDVDGPGGAGTLILGNMGFNWSGSNGIPVSIVWDGAGLLDAISQGLASGNTIAGTGATKSCDTDITCTTAGSDGLLFGAKQSYTLPIGPAPLATTTFDTTDIGTVTLGTNPSGTLPLVADTTSGSPMRAGPFPSFNANFDIDSITVLTVGGGPTFIQPADVNFVAPEQATPASINVNLGTVTDEAPAGTTMEYSTDGKGLSDPTKTWVTDNNGNNTITVNATQTVTNLVVDWRATDPGMVQAFATQNVTVTITDTTAPSITSTNAQNVATNVASTSDNVCFGAITVSDAIDPNPSMEWSHDGFNWNSANPDTGNLADNCSTGFGPDNNTVFWRSVDATGNTGTYQQTVTLNLPAGIQGKACTIDLATAGQRQISSLFTMRKPDGSPVQADAIDSGVTGYIDTTVFCPGPGTTLADCNPAPSPVELNSGQSFFNFDWAATPVRLFGQGTWTFETCPLPRSFDSTSGQWVSPDGSNQCESEFTPLPISMTVGPNQIGAHMLFAWGANNQPPPEPQTPCGKANCAIDVVVVWDVDCNTYQLTTTDPDGDGILSTPMADGPFKGWNAAFDINTLPGEPKIADGGYTTTVPVTKNPVSGASPLAVTPQALPAFTTDASAVRSCVGDCYKFTTTDLQSATDGSGAYNFAQVVLPLTEATPFWSLYRKFDEVTMSWKPFTVNGRNDVQTAPYVAGTSQCPEPGDGGYERPDHPLAGKLRGGDLCVQLTIEDGGPNDADGMANGSVSDPGGVAEVPPTALPAPSTGGGCTVGGQSASATRGGAWWLLAGMLGWLGWQRRKSR